MSRVSNRQVKNAIEKLVRNIQSLLYRFSVFRLAQLAVLSASRGRIYHEGS